MRITKGNPQELQGNPFVSLIILEEYSEDYKGMPKDYSKLKNLLQHEILHLVMKNLKLCKFVQKNWTSECFPQ